ncbi:MAG TPA: hypothetical protein VJL90_15800 [Pseudorhodoplanes sp.]|nr:hypothetical protein [Pseudorhodoplanes sp.]
MTRTHRAWHRVIWIVLAIVVGTGLVLALALRPAPATIAAPTTLERSR